MGAGTHTPPVGRPPLVDVAQELAARVPVTAPAPVHNLSDLTREQLDDRARAAGIKEPEKLANKAAVIDAIEATKNLPSGEGTTTNPEG